MLVGCVYIFFGQVLVGVRGLFVVDLGGVHRETGGVSEGSRVTNHNVALFKVEAREFHEELLEVGLKRLDSHLGSHLLLLKMAVLERVSLVVRKLFHHKTILRLRANG